MYTKNRSIPCGTWLSKLECLITVHCFDNSDNIAVSMAINVTVRDVRMTQKNALLLMRYLLHKSVVKESVPVCIETAARRITLA